MPDGKVGHDAFAVIRETIREMNKVAIGRVVLTNREHIIALEPMDKGLMGTLLRYPYEVRSADEYFDDIQDVKVTKDMLDLAKHIVNQKAGHFEPDKFEDQYETALLDLINQKRAGKPITAKARPRGENVVDLMDALRKSIGGGAAAATEAPKKPAKKARKAAAGQKEMLIRDPQEYFDDIQDVKVTKDMLDLARHIVNQKAGHFEPDKFEDQYETALVDLINQKRAGKPITAKERPRGENVVDLMDALRKSIGGAGSAKDAKPAKKPRKVASGQKEMLMPIAGKKPAKEAAAKKPAAKPQRKSA